MPKTTASVSTPYYVLKNGNQTVSTAITFDDPSSRCVCIYGFSNKSNYDKFVTAAGELLTPYPLVKGYLVNQISEIDAADDKGVCLGLVILDATEPTQPVVAAASMAIVLLSQQEKAKHVPTEFELTFDPKTNGYRLSAV